MVYCPNCYKETNEKIMCDNDCGTIECDKCGVEIYQIKNGEFTIGHNPKCCHDDCEEINTCAHCTGAL